MRLSPILWDGEKWQPFEQMTRGDSEEFRIVAALAKI
jgi:hypothetical protein